MKRGKIQRLLWLFPAIIFALHASTAYTYDTKEGGHIGISRKSIGLKIKLHGGDNLSQELGAYSREIINGDVNEDALASWMDHFYNPTTGRGLWGRYKPAPDKGKEWYEIAKKEYCNGFKPAAWMALGHALHLVQDMTVPPHTNDKAHFHIPGSLPSSGPIDPIPTYEDFIRDNWNAWINNYLLNYPLQNRQLPNIQSYFNEAANKSHGYPYDDTFTPLLQPPKRLTPEEKESTAKALVPLAVEYGAGLINTFWDDLQKEGCVPKQPGPGGDHPDDTFDVSTDVYLYEKFDLSGMDYMDMSLRTGLKKGRIGLHYDKILIQKLEELRNLPDTTPQEEVQQRLNEISAIKDKFTTTQKEDFEISPDVALLSEGFFEDTASFLFKSKEPFAFQSVNFSPEIIKHKPILVIPSGGLYGLESSFFFKASLDEYVKNGGTLIVFAQQHGYEFSILPVPQEADGTFKTIIGYGWTEDQSCFTNAVYFDTWHQMLSGQSRSTPTLNVDGYFTNYPSNTTVLLRRTANGQPAMISYPYGKGLVIVTSMYSDWAYGHSQASAEEIKLVRDMISWAKKPAQLPEIKPGETASVTVSVVNNTTTDASSVKLTLTDPDRNIISEQTINQTIPASQSATIPVTYTSTSTSALGIYHIDYELYDSQGNNPLNPPLLRGNLIQPRAETDSGRFVVSNPPTNPYKPSGLQFAVNTPDENVLQGQDVAYTVTIWNNSDKDRKLRLWKQLNHGIDIGFLEEAIVLANGSISRTYIQNMLLPSNTTIWVTFYEENGTPVQKGWWIYTSDTFGFAYVGAVYRTFKLQSPSVSVSASTDKTIYSRGEIVNLALNLQNKQSTAYTTTLQVRVADPSNALIYSQTLNNINLPASSASTQNLSFAIPYTAQYGFYTISAEVYDANNKKIGGNSASFEVPKSQISVIPSLPPTFIAGTNTIPFTITNTGKIIVSSGTLDVSLKGPDGVVVYTNSHPFSLATGQATTIDVPVSISPKFGNYTLAYTQSDETRIGSPTTQTIANTATIALTLDKPSYKVRDTANFTVNLTNTGKFNLDNASLTVSAPDAGYTDTKTISLGINPNATVLNYAIPIPETIAAGPHNVNIALTLPSGSLVSQNLKLTIPESLLAIGYSGPTTLTAGDTISLTIENRGGVDTSYTTENLTITDNRGVVIYQGSVTGTILAGEKKIFTNIQIPAQIASGQCYLSIGIKDNKTLQSSSLYQILQLTGLTATLQTRTDKEAYLKTEAITGISSIMNGQFGIENGSLKVTVNKITAGTGQFTHFLPKTGWGPFDSPYSVAVAPDGSVYVTDTLNNRIQKFDSNGNFVTKWGSYGSGDGQFYYPFGIAIAPDGSVYVADTYNHRIQKFDSNGNFITKWGSRGWYGDGQFNSPMGIAIAPDGSVYVADTGNNRIQKFDSNGNFITKWGSRGWYGDGQFDNPFGIAVAPDGSVYVADSRNNRVQKFDGNGNFITKWGSYGWGDWTEGQFQYPLGIAVAPDGSVYVADTYNHRIQKFDSNGNFITKWGSWGWYGDGQFSYPHGIAVAPDGSVYVADSGNHRIQKMMAPIETLFKAVIPVTQLANTSQDYTTNISTLNTTGKLYLQAKLKNSLGQTIATAEYPFYIVHGNTVLLFNTDKKYYRPGEMVTVTGEVKNLATVSLDNAVLLLNAGTTALINQTITVPANGSHPFTATTTAGSEGVVILAGKVTQNNSILIEITDQYEVANPKITASVSAPNTAGNEPFNINIEIKNQGKVSAVVSLQSSVDGQMQSMTIPAEETKLIQYSRQITNDTTYIFAFTGDLSQTITTTVIYGLSASMAINPSTVYPEGRIAIPVTITNTGQMDEQLEFTFRLSQESAVKSQETKKYYLSKGGSITDTLYYDLAKGSYQLTATSLHPTVNATANLSVKKENDITVNSLIGQQAGGIIPVTVSLNNQGYNDFTGTLALETDFYRYEEAVALSAVCNNTPQPTCDPKKDPKCIPLPQPSCSTSIEKTYTIDPAAAIPGTHALNAILYNNAGQQIAVRSSSLVVRGAVFQITQLPAYSTFTAGAGGSFIFTVKNTGNQEGEMSFTVKAMDALDQTRVEWLKPGEEKTLTFNFLLPNDLEEKDYFADYELKGQGSGGKGQVKYHVAGINLTVNALLDKQSYNVGETAHLTITVSSMQSAVSSINLFARVNYSGYEKQQILTLNGSQTMTFDIPLTEITGEKLFYGIYHAGGRSIHLNSLYIYKAGNAITITTDKQVYNPSEIVIITVASQQSGVNGTMTLTGPGNYSETFAFTGSATKGFALPATMTAGTYYINYQMTGVSGQTYSGSHAIDINGIQVKVKEASLDKAKYASTDGINLSLTIESNRNLSATLKTWIVDPNGNYTLAGEQGISLSSSDPLLVTGHSSLATASMGIHRLVYGIYSGDLLLSSGSEAFDVGNAVLLGVSTDKADYPNGSEILNIATSLYGTVSGTLEFFIDGASVGRDTVTFAGFSTHSRQLANIEPGPHILKTVLTAGGLSSSKEANFVYGSNLPDLVVSSIDAKRDRSTYIITVAIANQGKTPSGQSEITLYDGIGAIATLSVQTLAPGVITTISYNWNALGKAGGHTLYASVDPANSVREFNEKNNTASVNITVPEFTLDASATRAEYRANEDVGVVIDIANLTSDSAYVNLKINARIKDPSGNAIVNKTNDIQTLPPAFTTSYGFVWNTGSTPPGIYTITGTLNNPAAGTTLTQGSADFTIIPTPSLIGTLTLSKDKVIQGFALRADYALTNNGNIDLSRGDVRLEFISAGTGISATAHTQTFGFLQVLKGASNAFSIDKLDIEPGDYTVRLTAIAEGISFVIGEKPLKVLPPLEVTKGISLAPRALVLLDKKEEDEEDNKAQGSGGKGQGDLNQAIIIEALNSIGAYYTIITDKKTFKHEMRSGIYNTYILAGKEPLEDHLDEELKERVNSGEALILMGYKNIEDEKFKDVTGVKGEGSLEKKQRKLNITENPITQPGDLTIAGKVDRLKVTGDKTIVIGIVTEKGKTYPAIVLNPYGEGSAILFAFDSGESAKAYGSTVPYSNLLSNAITYIAPKKINPLPGYPIDVEIGIKSLGPAFGLKVKEALGTKGVILTYPSGKIDEKGITWELRLSAGSHETLHYLTKIDDTGGAYTNTTTVEYLKHGAYKTFDTYSLSIIAEDIGALKMRILHSLEGLPSHKDKGEIIEKYNEILNRPIADRKDIEEPIKDILDIIEDLEEYAEEEPGLKETTSALRLDLDGLLKIFGRKWAEEAE